MQLIDPMIFNCRARYLATFHIILQLGIIEFKEGEMYYGVEVTGRFIPSPTISYRNRTPAYLHDLKSIIATKKVIIKICCV
jgi:hypothetical protein